MRVAALGALCVAATVSTRPFGIYNGRMQGDMDANLFSLTNAISVSAKTLTIRTNSLASWPSAAPFPGDACIVSSNGVVYILTSPPNSTAWAATNKIAP